MDVALIDSPELLRYRFPGSHPLRPERYALAVSLMRAWGLLDAPHARVREPERASAEELLLFHTAEYVDAVVAASTSPTDDASRYGLGPGDTPAFPGMHEAASLCVGGTMAAFDAVLGGTATRAHHPAGGLHHAQADRASGFCVYNDAAVAIERATRDHAGLRIAYIDIDAHHGDGVEAAFADRCDVLTVSVHESGRYLFPGTGRDTDIGNDAGVGCALNVPLLPHSGPESYPLVMEGVIAPAVERFAPDLIVLQAGADSHRNDPLTHLDNSVASFDRLVRDVVSLAEDACDGRIVALGGGGYDTYSAVPRMWGCVWCRLLGIDPPDELPGEWLAEAERAALAADAAWHPVSTTYDEHLPDTTGDLARELASETEATVRRLRASHPLLA